jgi:hypothetical protein
LKKGKKLTKSVVDSTPQSVITHFHKRLAVYDRGDKRLSVEKLINDIKKFSANQRGGEGGNSNLEWESVTPWNSVSN